MLRTHHIALLCLLLASAACDTAVDPISDDGPPFSMYGFLNPLADTQAVQVFEVGDRLALQEASPIDATVTLTDLASGSVVQMQDSIVVFDGGRVAHVYWAPFRPAFNASYRLGVIRSDGVKSEVVVTVPPNMQLEEAAEFDPIARTVLFKLSGGNPKFIRAEADYQAVTLPVSTEPEIRVPITFDYTAEARQNLDSWEFRLNLREDFIGIIQRFVFNQIRPNDIIGLEQIDFSIMVVDDTWDPPGGVFEASALAQPGAFTNVTNGLGFFGAGYPLSVSWQPSFDELIAIGFAPCRYIDENGACIAFSDLR